jgi:mono/diheme cytochrome c family protein
MTRARLLFAPIAAALALASAVPFALSADDEDDDRQERMADAKASVVNNCLMCHGEDMISNHRLSAKQWTAEVEKMVGWGSPLPADQKAPVIEYLAATYPDTQAAPAPMQLTADAALALDRPPAFDPPAPASAEVLARGQALFAQHCATCHGPEARGGDLGTNLVEKPYLAREDDYHALLRDGRRRMPGFAPVLDARAEADLLAWLRARR